MKLSEKQENLVKQAGKLLKEAFPGDNLQFCFNLTTKHDNINFNIKASGILS